MILQSTSSRLKKSQSSTTETVIIIHVPDRMSGRFVWAAILFPLGRSSENLCVRAVSKVK